MTHILPRSTPDAQGIASTAVLAFVQALKKQVVGLHSFMFLRHGQVIAEGWWTPYEPDRPHMLFSLSKSFTSTAIGIAVSEGRLSIDDPVISFFPEEAPAQPSDNLKAMRVRHLLTMSTGHAEDPVGVVRTQEQETNWVRGFLSAPVAYAPGTRYAYSSGATYMLSAILQRLTGSTLVDYLRPRIFTPLGINNPAWETCPRGINTGGWGLKLTTEQVARFGQLYLQNGAWQGRQLIPGDWVQQASIAQISNGTDPASDWAQGYGYQFWRCRNGAYRADGAFGQHCLILQDQDAVIVMTGGIGEMQTALNLIWQHLLPAMLPGQFPEDPQTHEAARAEFAALAMEPAQGCPTSPVAPTISGKTWQFEPNAQKIAGITLRCEERQTTLTIQDDRGQHVIVCGHGAWVKGMTAYDNGASRPVAASAAWSSDETLTIKLCFCETPFCPTLMCRFSDGQLTFDYHANVAFGPMDRPQLTGRPS